MDEEAIVERGASAGAAAAGLPIGPEVRLPPRRLPEVPGAGGEERPYARPDYSQRFRCIGSACEDTCCTGWEVPIDQATYERYRGSEAMRPHLGKLIVLNTVSPTSNDFARITSVGSGRCGFLDEDRMCSVQKALGEEMLSKTCQVFPRAVLTNAGQMERALTLSCPEAARVVLEDPDLLAKDAMWRHGWPRGAGGHYAAVWDGKSVTDGGWAVAARDARLAVRQFCLLQLTDRSYPLWQRIYLLGILVRRLEVLRGDLPIGVWCERNPAALRLLLADSARVATAGRLTETMEAIEAEPGLQMEMVAEMLRTRLAGPPVPERFLECVRAYEEGIGFAGARSEAEVIGNYRAGYAGEFRELMEQHPQVLENYLVNHMFKHNFPFGRRRTAGLEEPDAADSQILLLLHAALAQTLLVGMARRHGAEGVGMAGVVKLVQSLAKTIEHNLEYLTLIVAKARVKGLSGPRGAGVLLRII